MSDLKPTADERREVAARLRELIYQYGMPDGERFHELLNMTIGDPSGYRTYVSTIQRLADLIEPEEGTCRMDTNGSGEGLHQWWCSECGGCTVAFTRPPFCSRCGARVKGEADTQA